MLGDFVYSLSSGRNLLIFYGMTGMPFGTRRCEGGTALTVKPLTRQPLFDYKSITLLSALHHADGICLSMQVILKEAP